jgi:hypothetical protein
VVFDPCGHLLCRNCVEDWLIQNLDNHMQKLQISSATETSHNMHDDHFPAAQSTTHNNHHASVSRLTMYSEELATLSDHQSREKGLQALLKSAPHTPFQPPSLECPSCRHDVLQLILVHCHLKIDPQSTCTSNIINSQETNSSGVKDALSTQHSASSAIRMDQTNKQTNNTAAKRQKQKTVADGSVKAQEDEDFTLAYILQMKEDEKSLRRHSPPFDLSDAYEADSYDVDGVIDLGDDSDIIDLTDNHSTGQKTEHK